MGDPGPMPIDQRIEVAGYGARASAYGPTATQARNMEIAEREFKEVGRALDQVIDQEFAALKVKLDAAGVPWTPGRGVPGAD